MSSALLTDRYELTMIDAARRSGVAERRSVFEVFTRRLPAGRRYGVLAGTGRLIDALSEFRFGDDELAWLRRERVVSAATLDWLASYRFTGTIRAYREGEVYFPGSPVLTVEAGFAEGVVLETIVLSILNADSAIAAAAARMVQVAEGRPIIEMGARRAHEAAAVTAARAAWITGFASTSNLEAGRRYGIATAGTAAHAFTLVHDSEEEAFAAQVATMGTGTTLLVDTYDIERGVETAVRVAGPGLGAVRIDSGELGAVAREVRAQLDALGATSTRIIATSDLDEYAIARLRDAPIDGYGVGTSLVTGSGAPTSGMVYKLVAIEADGQWRSVEKHSEGKLSVGGRKQAVRRVVDGVAVSEDVYVEDPPIDASAGRHLVDELVRDGAPCADHTGPDALRAAREHHQRAIAELPAEALTLEAGEPAIPTRYL